VSPQPNKRGLRSLAGDRLRDVCATALLISHRGLRGLREGSQPTLAHRNRFHDKDLRAVREGCEGFRARNV